MNIHANTEFIHSGKYLIAPIRSGFLIIHVKRALERILYDQSIANFIKQPLNVQMLLFPIEKKLELQEIRLFKSHLKLLEQLGFNLEIIESMLLIKGAPEMLPEDAVVACLDSLIQKLEVQDQTQEDIAHSMMAEMVKSTAKNYQISNKSEIQQLVEQLFQCREHEVSPSQQKIISILRHEDLNQFLL
jgi:DNA mismatch repair protein MutL